MITGKGKSVYSGIAIGRIFLYRKEEVQVVPVKIQNTEQELSHFHTAAEAAKKQLKALYEKTLADVGESEAMIIDVQLMMLEDLDYIEAIENKIIVEKDNAAYAVQTVGERFAETFLAMEDAYMKARATDVRDISGRLILSINGGSRGGFHMSEPMIILAEDLAPSETVQFEKSKILAIVTQKGSANSHTAILARSMGIPSLVNADITLGDELNGRQMIVNGDEGLFYIDPDEALLEKEKEAKRQALKESMLLDQLRGQESLTLDGKKINLYSNIGGVEDVVSVLQNDAEGIGLFRSEFLYLGRDTYPTEQEQFESYRAVVEKMAGRKVIIRTLDIGADKQAGYFGLGQEENPAMGYRAIRICLDRVDVFKTQLRAIYRASVFGKVSIMFPMIISVKEIIRTKEIVEEIKQELSKEAIPFGEVELGIMIETPAAVMVADELAKEVQFFSVGTNDLTQYTLAIDRQNQHLDSIYDSHHPAIMRMLQMIVDSAHRNGIWAGICGELAADKTLTETFVKMGYDELSVSPGFTLGLRKKIREIKSGEEEAK